MSDSLIPILNTVLGLGALVALFSGLIHGYTGFGAALLMMPLLALLFGPVQSIAITSVVVLSGSAQLYPGALRHAHWAELLPMSLAVMIITPVAAILLFSLNPEIVRRAMGAFVLLFAVLLMSGWSYRGRRGPLASTVAGALAAGITGISGLGGPALALYFLSSPEPAQVQRANIVIGVSVVVLVFLVSIAIGGALTDQTLLRAIILIPAYVLGTWSGSRLFAVAPKEYFRRVAIWLLLVTGVGVILF